jgi:hypothetical protein
MRGHSSDVSRCQPYAPTGMRRKYERNWIRIGPNASIPAVLFSKKRIQEKIFIY